MICACTGNRNAWKRTRCKRGNLGKMDICHHKSQWHVTEGTRCQSGISGNSFFEVANIQLFLSKYSAHFFSLDHSPQCVLFYIRRKRWNEGRSYSRKTTWKNRELKKQKQAKATRRNRRTKNRCQKPKAQNQNCAASILLCTYKI